MSIESQKSSRPDFAKDLKLNVGSLMFETILTYQQKYGCLLACANAIGQPEVVRVAKDEAGNRLSQEAKEVAKAAAVIVGMNNDYYRAVRLLSNEVYSSLPERLRLNLIANLGVEKADFELFSLGVSAINACGMWLDAHKAELRKQHVTSEGIQAVHCIVAVINAVSRVLAGERAD